MDLPPAGPTWRFGRRASPHHSCRSRRRRWPAGDSERRWPLSSPDTRAGRRRRSGRSGHWAHGSGTPHLDGGERERRRTALGGVCLLNKPFRNRILINQSWGQLCKIWGSTSFTSTRCQTSYFVNIQPEAVLVLIRWDFSRGLKLLVHHNRYFHCGPISK